MTEKAYAKINLTLDVTGKLPNGYHTVKMLMQTVALHDEITVTQNRSGEMTLSCEKPYVPQDMRNLALRAADLFFRTTGIACAGLHIAIEKHIPVAAGLAGGSTDAATVLQMLNRIYKAGLSMAQLCEIGVQLGADVPYCLHGGTMLAEGIGEILTPISQMPMCHVVLCKPDFSVSTADIYAQMNGGRLDVRPDTAGMLEALRVQDYEGICHRLYNVMQTVTGKRYAEIGQIQDILLSCGADGAVMSGSGPTTFGLFRSEDKAKQAYQVLREKFVETHLTKIWHPMGLN